MAEKNTAPGAQVVNEPDIELTDAQLNDALRGIEIQSRSFRQMGDAVRVYFMVRKQGDAAARRVKDLNELIVVSEKKVEDSKNKEFDTIRRLETDRRAKLATEEANFQASKKELDDKLDLVAREIAGKERELKALASVLEQKEQLVQAAIEEEELRLVTHRAYVEDEMMKLDNQLAAHKEEGKRIEAGLADLRERIRANTEGFLTATNPRAEKPVIDKSEKPEQGATTLED